MNGLDEEARAIALGLVDTFSEAKAKASMLMNHAGSQIYEDLNTIKFYLDDPRNSWIGMNPLGRSVYEGVGLTSALLGSIVSRSSNAEKYAAWLNQVGIKMKQEQYGQHILEQMDEVGRSPRQVIDEFWKETYPSIPPEAQERFHKYIKNITGFSPGSVIGTGPKGENIVGKSWRDLYSGSDAPSVAEYLEGTERGLVALMEIGNQRRLAEGVKTAPKMLENIE